MLLCSSREERFSSPLGESFPIFFIFSHYILCFSIITLARFVLESREQLAKQQGLTIIFSPMMTQLAWYNGFHLSFDKHDSEKCDTCGGVLRFCHALPPTVRFITICLSKGDRLCKYRWFSKILWPGRSLNCHAISNRFLVVSF